ncbi:tRNA dihydrouridine(20/20a) synthase DusA [Casimicrobium huifangae]|uniref:tRNA dihydrouridine(20/20a) synthase DusA n=1 Tax=Casimicrobium huifangae TaxID=2591109 RepID=UPI0023527E61|nr:tRNA dihydrouridine(20/20a) synthase DusA [Casimicrobium huifangae]
MTALDHNAWRLTTAPMMDWTDRHCRVLFRHLAPSARLYTEMVTTGPLIYGNAEQHRRHLKFTAVEHPVALQLGGSEREDLARAAKLGADFGYDEINLNCGCPSERVQRGAFGACLMAEPTLVADCVKAMIDAVPSGVPVTVKHRIGLDYNESYDFVRDFVGTVAEAGCRVFIVHARNAVLKGLSPKENREVPPLRYDVVTRLRTDFPSLILVLNGGITTAQQCLDLLDGSVGTVPSQPHGVMLGRAAYHDSYMLAHTENALFGTPLPSRDQIVEQMIEYTAREIEATRGQQFHTRVRDVARHMLGLYSGQVGGKAWRRMLSDARLLNDNDPELLRRAMPYQSDYDDHRQPLLDALSG